VNVTLIDLYIIADDEAARQREAERIATVKLPTNVPGVNMCWMGAWGEHVLLYSHASGT
jgi:hypothetical protein